MKLRIFISAIFFTLLFFDRADAQHYIPMPEQNVVWQEDQFYTYEPCWDDAIEIYYFDGDTSINNIRYKKLYSEKIDSVTCGEGGVSNPHLVSSTSTPKFFLGAFRQDTIAKKVFIFLKDSLKENLLYDFNLKIGDTIKYFLPDLNGPNAFNYEFPVVDSIDSVLINGSFHKRYLYEFSFQTSDALIEGIGNTSGLIFPRTYYTSNSWIELTCVTLKGNKIYPDVPWTIDCYTPGFSTAIPVIKQDISNSMIVSGGSETNIRISDNSYQALTLRIVSILGQTYYQASVNESSQVLLPDNILPPGLYVATLFSEKQVIDHVKFIKY